MNCAVTMRSMTYAIKAQRVLDERMISSKIIKLDPKLTVKGCAYGLRIHCVNLYSATEALKENGIKFSETLRLPKDEP